MGFKLNINNILRQDISETLEVGKEYSFEKPELTIIADDIQIWLTKKDWTVLADTTATMRFIVWRKTSLSRLRVRHIQ